MASLIGYVVSEIKSQIVHLHGYKPAQEKGRNPRQCWVAA
jgi:hypothetical protein